MWILDVSKSAMIEVHVWTLHLRLPVETKTCVLITAETATVRLEYDTSDVKRTQYYESVSLWKTIQKGDYISK